MAIKINFDTANNPETPTLILATRDGNKLGQLEAKQIELNGKLIGASEISFILNKYIDGRLTNLWDKVADFKLVYCKEWDLWFEITVEIDEDTKTVKTVFCTQLGQAELSQLMLYNIEINTEDDIARDDYKISILCDEDHPDGSILHRLLEKAPHYSIAHVDATIASIQRSFSFDDTSIHDALQEIAEEIGCLFVFHSGSDANGNPQRAISVYDLEQYCNDCGHRGEFTDVCPKCGSTNIREGYGEDTTIYVTSDELASNNIQFTTDTDSVKNCFKLEAGDDLMTATIRNCNPNGTDYIWYLSDSIKEDMSDELVARLQSYDEEYEKYYKDKEIDIDSTFLIQYNNLVNKYSTEKKSFQTISNPIKGYSSLMTTYYDVIDLSLYLESGMMPTVEMSGTTASAQAALLTSSSLSPIAVTNIEYASVETVNSVALGMAKVLVKPTYKVEINGTSSLSDLTDSNTKTWKGSFVVTNYSDEEDTATTGTITITVNGNAELFTKQKIEKALNKADTEDYSIVGLFEKDLASFKAELKKYALKPLSSFRDACQSCIDILIEQGATKADLYNNLYLPYWEKLKAIEVEMKVREDEIAAIDGVYDEEGNLVKKGLATDIEKSKEMIQDELDFEKYLGTDLWFEFSSYRREDKYKNENYISDGLNNAELFTRALEFIEVANNEIYKSSELQHSISSSLKNLMAIEKFKSLADHFEVGNWMRVQIDDSVYKLRLLEYTIDLDNFEDISVVFSDVSKVRNGISDLEDLFSQASSMTTHYDSVKKQANKGQEAQGTIEQWLQQGLNSALVRINSNDSEEVSMTQNGILCRSYDSFTDTYSPEQLKLTHNIMAYTNDDWMTVKQAIGKHEYVIYDKKTDSWVPEIGYGMSAEFVTAGQIMGATIVGGEIYSSNYSNGTGGSTTPMGTYINLQTGEFSFGGDKFAYNGDTLTLKNVTIQWDSLTEDQKPTAENISGLESYLNQLDNMIGTYSQSNDPSTSWTTAQKQEHIGDLWFNPDTGLTKRWNGNSWTTITDKDLEKLAQSKAQIFTSTPTPPYSVGDLWVEGSTGDIKHCVNARANGTYVSTDWVKSSKYTDDTALNTFINGTYADDLEIIRTQIDKKAETYWSATDPSVSWATNDIKNEHVGDLWHNTTSGVEYVYTKINNADGSIIYKWEESTIDIPDEVFDAINGKAAIYITLPENTNDLNIGDLLIPSSSTTLNGQTYRQGKVYRWTGSAWLEISYTDDTTANSALSVAQNAKTLGETLSNGLGFRTEIGGTYVISPVIAGGTLLIGNQSGTYAQITTDGILKASGAEITGKLYGDTVTYNGVSTHNFKVENGYVYAGWNPSKNYYNFMIEPNGHVTIRGSLSVEGSGSSGGDSGGSGGGSYELTDADRAYLESIKNSAASSASSALNSAANASNYAINASNSASSASIYANNASNYASDAASYATASQTSYNDIVRLGEINGYVAYGVSAGTSGGKYYFKVNSEGLLETENAVIHGTVHATSGEFFGDLYSDLVDNTSGYYNFVAKNGYVGIGCDGSNDKHIFAVQDDVVRLGAWIVQNTGLFCMQEQSNGNQVVITRINPARFNSDGSLATSELFIGSPNFQVYHDGDVSTNGTLTVKGDTSLQNLTLNGFSVGNGNITIDTATDSESSDASKKAATFKLNRDVYFTPSNGIYDYDTCNNIIRVTGDGKSIFVSNSNVITRLFGSSIYLRDTTTAVTSDERLKTNIKRLSTTHEDLFNTLRPVSFKYINGTSDRTHYGFIAQEVRDAALSVGMTTQDIAAFVSIPSDDSDMDEEYALRYDEFISLNTHMIQKCLKEIDSLKAENEILKQQLDVIKQSF